MNKIAFVICWLTAVVAFGQSADDYKDLQRSVEKAISGSSGVVASEQERADLKTLQFLLQDLRKQVAASDWKRANETQRKMQIALQRSEKVAADAPRRKAAEEQRRHRELVQQRERQHREEMNQRNRQQQQLINEIRNRRY
jgi:hypothetical protein